MLDEAVVRAKARAAVQEGKLPARAPDRVWGGPRVEAEMEFEVRSMGTEAAATSTSSISTANALRRGSSSAVRSGNHHGLTDGNLRRDDGPMRGTTRSVGNDAQGHAPMPSECGHNEEERGGDAAARGVRALGGTADAMIAVPFPHCAICSKQLLRTDDFFLDDGACYHRSCIERLDREDAPRCAATAAGSAPPPTPQRPTAHVPSSAWRSVRDVDDRDAPR
jgi:hypothetical protein